MTIIIAKVSLGRIDFQLRQQNQNKLIRKLGADCVMRVVWDFDNNDKFDERLRNQARHIFRCGIEVGGRLYKYAFFQIFLLFFKYKQSN